MPFQLPPKTTRQTVQKVLESWVFHTDVLLVIVIVWRTAETEAREEHVHQEMSDLVVATCFV